MIILSIDPGVHTGWAHIETDGRKLLYYGALSPDRVKDRTCRENLLTGAGLLAIEDQYLGKNAQSMKSVIESKCWWIVTASDLGIPVHQIYPSEWQKCASVGWYIGIKRDALAKNVRAYVESRFHLPARKVKQDTICAIGIGSYMADMIAMGRLKG